MVPRTSSNRLLRSAPAAKRGWPNPVNLTQRAFLNGKLDLAQAEAVADLIASNTEASKKTALHAMRGGFSEVLKQLRERMILFANDRT